MPVELAAREQLCCIEPVRKDTKIRSDSPGISSAPQGVTGVKEFLAAMRTGDGDVDLYAIHRYGETLGQLYDYRWSTYYHLGAYKPVLVTEYRGAVGEEHVEGFCMDSCIYINGLEWVERYTLFRAMRNTGTVGKWAAC